MLDLIHKTFWQ